MRYHPAGSMLAVGKLPGLRKAGAGRFLLDLAKRLIVEGRLERLEPLVDRDQLDDRRP